MSDQGLSLLLVHEQHTLSVEWCHQLLSQLWARGLEFTRPVADQGEIMLSGVTWHDALGAPCHYLGADGRDEAPLREVIAALADSGVGSLTVWDGDMDMLLTLDPAGLKDSWYLDPPTARRRPPFGFIRLFVDGTNIRDDRPGIVPRTGLRLHTVDTFISWAEALCAELKPLFGVGYNPAYLENALASDEASGQSVADVADVFDDILAALGAGNLPPTRPWMLFTYAAQRLAGARTLDELVGDAGSCRWVHGLPGQGLSTIALPVAWQHQSEIASEVKAAALHLERRGEAARQGWHELWEQAIRLYERAAGIYHTAGDHRGEASVRREISHLLQIMERRASEEQAGKA